MTKHKPAKKQKSLFHKYDAVIILAFIFLLLLPDPLDLITAGLPVIELVSLVAYVISKNIQVIRS